MHLNAQPLQSLFIAQWCVVFKLNRFSTQRHRYKKSGADSSSFLFIFIPHPIHYPRTTLLTLPPSQYLRSGVTSQALLPPPHYGTCLPVHFYRENNSAFIFIPSSARSRRIVPTHVARRSRQLIPFLHFCQ